MKILGLTKEGSGYAAHDAYIVQISERELVKVADKAGYRDEFPKLKVGDEYPIDEGYDFRSQILKATKDMQTAYESFQKASTTMTHFASLMLSREERNE